MARRKPRLRPGDCLTLTLMREPVYADASHTPRYKETTKSFVVTNVGTYGATLRPTRRGRVLRSYRLAGEYLTSSVGAGKSPLRYAIFDTRCRRNGGDCT